jgi:Tol biopolymer transport system component
VLRGRWQGMRAIALSLVALAALPGAAYGYANHDRIVYAKAYACLPGTADTCGSVWSATLDGRDTRQVTPDERFWTTYSESVPELALSPNGRTIAYAVRKSSTSPSPITLVGSDGTDKRSLGTINGEDPDFTPDGRSLVYSRRLSRYKQAIYTVPLGASDPDSSQVPLVAWGPEWAVQQSPTYSSDGKRVAFVSSHGPDGASAPGIYTTDSTGQNPRRVVSASSNGEVNDPSFSPDGRRIVFARDTGTNAFENDRTDLWVVDLEAPLEVRGVNPLQITLNMAADMAPDWAPDGRTIIFERGPKEYFSATQPRAIHAIRPDGTDERVVVPGASHGGVNPSHRQPSESVTHDDLLAATFQPLLRFDEGEHWRPLEIGAFLREPVPGFDVPLNPICTTGALCRDTYASTDDFRAFPTGGYIDINPVQDHVDPQGDDWRSPHEECVTATVVECDTGARTAIYYHVTPPSAGGYSYIDYWWFYRYNDFLAGDHEGDWEGMVVAPSLTVTGTFDFAAFDQHGHQHAYLRSLLTCDGGDAGSCGTAGAPVGKRVWAFVAGGTHATYPDECANACVQENSLPEADHGGEVEWGRNFDDPVSGSLRRFPAANGWAVPLTANWVDWPGRWGSTGNEGDRSPRSPGAQERFRCPGTENDADPNACPSSRRATFSRGGTERACATWFGAGIAALHCAPDVLRRAVDRGRVGEVQSPALVTSRRADRVAAGRGVTQILGAPMQRGTRIRVGRFVRRGGVIRVRASDRGRSIEATFDERALRRVPRRAAIQFIGRGRAARIAIAGPRGTVIRPSHVRTRPLRRR